MSFVLSEINHDGIIMTSDSSETLSGPYGTETFEEVDKTLYFELLNIGISTWGKASIPATNESINEWLEKIIGEFVVLNVDCFNQSLVKLANFLAQKLDQEFNLSDSLSNTDLSMGLHIAGYDSRENKSPGICHVYIGPGRNTFDPQITKQPLPLNEIFHLRNGMYEGFAKFWPIFSDIDKRFRDLILSGYPHLDKHHLDPLVVRAEWVGNWVRQMCLAFKTAGFKEYIGKSVKILVFDHEGKMRRFRLPEIEKYS